MNPKHQKEISWIIRDKYHNQINALPKEDLNRLKAGEPVAYIIGYIDFLACRINLSTRPLIPRPETEYWLEILLSEINKQKGKPIKCLDIFAGSGCIGIALLKHCSNIQVDFAEKNPKFLLEIENNCLINLIAPENFSVKESNVFSSITGQYDFILANPPYVPSSRRLAKSVAGYEPSSALFAGSDGLLLIKKFLNEVSKYLNVGGQVWLEFDSGQKKRIEGILQGLGCVKMNFYKDQYSRWRFVVFSFT